MSTKYWKLESRWTSGDIFRQAEKDESYVSAVREAQSKMNNTVKHQNVSGFGGVRYF